jgi:hypothetical protein
MPINKTIKKLMNKLMSEQSKISGNLIGETRRKFHGEEITLQSYRVRIASVVALYTFLFRTLWKDMSYYFQFSADNYAALEENGFRVNQYQLDKHYGAVKFAVSFGLLCVGVIVTKKITKYLELENEKHREKME